MSLRENFQKIKELVRDLPKEDLVTLRALVTEAIERQWSLLFSHSGHVYVLRDGEAWWYSQVDDGFFRKMPSTYATYTDAEIEEITKKAEKRWPRDPEIATIPCVYCLGSAKNLDRSPCMGCEGVGSIDQLFL